MSSEDAVNNVARLSKTKTLGLYYLENIDNGRVPLVNPHDESGYKTLNTTNGTVRLGNQVFTQSHVGSDSAAL